MEKTKGKSNKVNVKMIIAIIIIMIAILGVLKIVERNRRSYEVESVEEYKYFVLKQNNKFGVIDAKGNTIIEPKYTEVIIPNPSKDVFVCKQEDTSKVYNSKNKELYTKYDSIDAIELKNIASDLMYEKSILKVQKDNKYGLIDFSGKEILKTDYSSIEALPYKEGEVLVQRDNKYGIVNMKGTEIIKCEYDKISADNYYTNNDEYKYSGYIVGNKTQEGYRYGFINSEGNKILDNEYNEISRITEIKDNNNIYLISAKNGQYGLTKNGKEITSNEYQSMTYEIDRDLIIVEKSQKYGAISIEGKTIIPVQYDEINVNGLYMYANNTSGVTVFDEKGKEVNISTNSYKYSTDNEKYFITINNSENEAKYGIVDKNGNQIVDEKYSYIGYLFADYFIASDKNRNLGIIDSNENIKLEFKYSSIQKITDKNIVQASINGSELTIIYTNYLEKSGEMENAYIQSYDDYIKLYNENEAKYFDNNGNELKNTQIFTNNKLLVKNEDGKYGFTDKNGNIKVECTYDNATEFNKYGFAGVKQDGRWGIIDEDGHVILTPTYSIEYFEPDFIGKYYKVVYGFGEFYYTDEE